MTYGYIMPKINVAWSPDPAPARPHVTERQFHGKRPVRPPKDPREDLLILEVRRLREQCNILLADIHIIVIRLGFNKSLSWIRGTTRYHNRSHLVPAPNAEPYLKEST